MPWNQSPQACKAKKARMLGSTRVQRFRLHPRLGTFGNRKRPYIWNQKKHCITAMFKVHWKWKIWLPALSQVSARGNARGFCTFWLSCWMCFRVWKKWCIILMTGWRDDSWLKVGSDQIPLWIVRLGLYNSINCPVDWECGPFTNQYNKIIKGWRWWRRVLKTHMAPFPLWHFGWSWSGTN